MNDKVQYLTIKSLEKLKKELINVKDVQIPEIAKRIDEAKQLGDLSENAEYHQAKDDMAWAQGRLVEIEHIIDNAEIIEEGGGSKNEVSLGSNVVVKVNGNEREFQIVGQQESDPLSGKISNESPIGKSLLGAKLKEEVKVETPAGEQIYKIVEIK